MSGVVLTMALSSMVMASCSQGASDNKKMINGTSVEVNDGEQTGQSVAKVITADEFEQLARDTNNVLIDVRTPEEFNSGHIEGARNMNIYGTFESDIQNLDKAKTYLIYCRSGGRSNSAMQMMKEAGFTTLYDLRGGIGAWQSSGKPVK